jgi:hypothetical protein
MHREHAACIIIVVTAAAAAAIQGKKADCEQGEGSSSLIHFHGDIPFSFLAGLSSSVRYDAPPHQTADILMVDVVGYIPI